MHFAGCAELDHRKRKIPETVEEVLEWFRNLRRENALVGFSEKNWDNLIQRVSANSITGKKLLSFERVDLDEIGASMLGPKRTLLDKINELRTSILSAEGRQNLTPMNSVVLF